MFFFLRQSTQLSPELQKDSLSSTPGLLFSNSEGGKRTKVFQPPLVQHTKVRRIPMLTLEVENPSQDCLLQWVLAIGTEPVC